MSVCKCYKLTTHSYGIFGKINACIERSFPVYYMYYSCDHVWRINDRALWTKEGDPSFVLLSSTMALAKDE